MEMTTEHVSVPRDDIQEVYERICAMHGAGSQTARLLGAILSRATPKVDAELNYATKLASVLWRDHYASEAPNWEPMTDLYGVLSQIDNMLTGLSRATPSTQAVTDRDAYAACKVGRITRDEPSEGEIERMKRVLENFAKSRGAACVDHCMCDACENVRRHDSDCAVHNEPAMPKGECDCTLSVNEAAYLSAIREITSLKDHNERLISALKDAVDTLELHGDNQYGVFDGDANMIAINYARSVLSAAPRHQEK